MNSNVTGIIGSNTQVLDRLVPQPQYADYAELINNGFQHIYTFIFTSMEMLDIHFHQILCIMQDGIETDQVQRSVIFVHFTDNETVKLSIFDYWFNLLFWGLPVGTHHKIDSRYLWWQENITQDSIRDYINNKFLRLNRDSYTNKELGNLIDDVMYKFQFIDKFSLYLYNTANNEDTINLMKENLEFFATTHSDLSQIPIIDVKDESMKLTNKGIECILNSRTHWAIPYFKAQEGINIKQYREFLFNKGTVPNDEGSVYPEIINGNYCNRGITRPTSYIIDGSNARRAQILGHENVGTSGSFARILNLNNMDDRLFPDPDYVCDSKNFVKITINNKKALNMVKNRYFRFTEDGVEYHLSQDPCTDSPDLIGKTILLRSPITCASRSRGLGICHRCYGGLAKTNYDINIGRMAAELLSSALTQRLLSAKHLLESNVQKLDWCPEFNQFFELNFSAIRILQDIDAKDLKRYQMMIHTDAISSDGDESDEGYTFNEYVTSFYVTNTRGETWEIGTSQGDNMYIGVELDKLIKRRTPDENGFYIIPFEDLKEKNLFFIEVTNNALSRTLERVKHLLNKSADVKKAGTKGNMLQSMIDTIIDGGLTIDSVHLEVMIAHQCVSYDTNILDPQWQYPNEKYRMVTLNERLRDNPSVTVSLMYNDINKLLFYPLTFMKSKASVVDLFFMQKPQVFMSTEFNEANVVDDKEVEGLVKPFNIAKDYDDDSDSIGDLD